MTAAADAWTLTGKTCVVTGATAGIGEITALELARAGARVFVVGRSASRCQASRERIRQATGRDVETLIADLSERAQVERLANEILDLCPRLDVLINNAGAIYMDRRESPDGIELTWALNHLAPYLLTHRLLDRLQASAPARVITVASEAHRAGKIDFDDLEGRRRYRGFTAYAQSKLANILFTNALSRRLEATAVTANSLHPGFVASNFFAGPGTTNWIVRTFLSPFAISPEKGAETSTHLAESPDVAGQSGLYFIKKKPAKPSPAALNQETAERLWDVSAAACGLTPASPPAGG